MVILVNCCKNFYGKLSDSKIKTELKANFNQKKNIQIKILRFCLRDILAVNNMTHGSGYFCLSSIVCYA